MIKLMVGAFMGEDKILKFWRRMAQANGVINIDGGNDGMPVDVRGHGHLHIPFDEFMTGHGERGYVFPVAADTGGQGDYKGDDAGVPIIISGGGIEYNGQREYTGDSA